MAEDDPEPPEPHVQPTGPGVLAAWLVVGLIAGWALRPLSQQWSGTAPVVTWTQPLALFLVTAVLLVVAWLTRQSVRRRERLEPHRAVNRLVLAKACALVGALVAGGYGGYALSWIGMAAELADERMLRSGIAAVGGLCMCGAALLLERACRVRDDDGSGSRAGPG